MNPNFRTIALIAAALGLIVSLFVALSPDDGDEAAPSRTVATTEPATTAGSPPTTTTRPERVPFLVDGTDGDIERGRVRLGRQVVITVRSSVTDRAHLHAYNLLAPVAPGKPGRIEFTASIPGQFEIELEDRHQLIGLLEVRP